MKIKHAAAVLGVLTLCGGLVLTQGTGAAQAGGGPAPGIRVQDAGNVVEMDIGDPAPILTFAVTTDFNFAAPCEVVIQTVNGTASGAGDYLPFSMNMVFPAATPSVNVNVTTTPDNLYEPDALAGTPDYEDLRLIALPGEGINFPACPILDDTGTGSIQDDDAPGILFVNLVPDLQECESAIHMNHPAHGSWSDGTVQTTYRLSRNLAGGESIEFDLNSQNGTAIEPSDYGLVSQHVVVTGPTFFPIDDNGTPAITADDFVLFGFEIPFVNDFSVELDEFFKVILTNFTYTGPNQSLVLDDQQIITIKNDDIPGNEIYVHDASAWEGDVPSDDAYLNFVFESRFPAICDGIRIHFYTTPGTAQQDGNGPPPGPGDDYFYREGYVVIAPGNTTEDKRVFIREDTNIEDDETMYMNIDEPIGAPGDPQGLGTILDDDFPTVNIGDAEIVEGTGGVKYAVFDVTLSPATTPHSFASVDYYTSDVTATGGSCFVPDTTTDYCSTSGRLYFSPYQTSNQIWVEIVTDGRPENNEYFDVLLFDPNHLIAGDMSGEGTIWNDDDWVVNGIDIAVLEGTPPGDSNHAVVVTLRLNAPAPNPAGGGPNNPPLTSALSIDWDTSPLTATGGAGTPPDDYINASGSVSWPNGTTDATASVTIVVDELIELDETLKLIFSNGSNFYEESDCSDGGCFRVVPGHEPIITIVNDDEEIPETGINHVPEMTMVGFAMALAGLVLVLGTKKRRTA